MLRGSEEQISQIQLDEDFQRVMQRADLVADGLGLVPALIGEGLARGISIYQEELAVVS